MLAEAAPVQHSEGIVLLVYSSSLVMLSVKLICYRRYEIWEDVDQYRSRKGKKKKREREKTMPVGVSL